MCQHRAVRCGGRTKIETHKENSVDSGTSNGVMRRRDIEASDLTLQRKAQQDRYGSGDGR